MKKNQLVSIIIGLMLAIPTSHVSAQDITPYYDIIGGISVVGEFNRAMVNSNKPYTLNLNVPQVCVADGFDVGFRIQNSVWEQPIPLDSIKITRFEYDIYHTDSFDNETPVLLSDNSPAVGIKVKTFGDETTLSAPSVFTTDLTMWNEASSINSTNDTPIIGSTVNNVGDLFVTRQKLRWGSSQDFTKPVLGQGYIVRWHISFIPTYDGVEYPEVMLTIGGNDGINIVYKVADVPLPELVSLKSISETYPNSSDEGTVLRMSGEQLEYFKLQRSIDLVTWTDWGFGGEGGNWVGPHTIPDGEVGFYSNTYEWVMFDQNYPNERRRPAKEFYRMVWTGVRGTWRDWSPVP